MARESGKLVYKCRACGELTEKTHVPDGVLTMAAIVGGFDTPKAWGGTTPDMYDVHSCKNGELGLMDLIKFVPDKEESR